MQGVVNDLTGQTFGRLTAIRITGSSLNHHKLWECRCECGEVVEVDGTHLRSGNTRSCGCLRKEKTRERVISMMRKRKGLE